MNNSRIRRFYGQRLALTFLMLFAACCESAHAATLFESGTLGTVGVPWQDVANQIVLGENINSSAFGGVRFQLSQPVVVERIGGHFVGSPISASNSFFGSIVQLDDDNDIPDSNDLSTPDVRGTALPQIPEKSAEVFSDLNLALDPGWYALMFGSGLFGSSGHGAALLNNSDIDTPDYLGFMSGFGWGARLQNKRFIVEGHVVPEPTSL